MNTSGCRPCRCISENTAKALFAFLPLAQASIRALYVTGSCASQQVAASQLSVSPEQDTPVPLFTVIVDSPLQSKASQVAGASQQVAALQAPLSPEQDTSVPLFNVLVGSPLQSKVSQVAGASQQVVAVKGHCRQGKTFQCPCSLY